MAESKELQENYAESDTPRTDAIRGLLLPREVVNSHELLELALSAKEAECKAMREELDVQSAMATAALQVAAKDRKKVEAMREAIWRAVDQLHGGMSWHSINPIRVALLQSLNPKNEEGKSPKC